MISFIIIGKNIQHTVRICLDSVFSFIKNNNINTYEVIYSDSNSTDETISIVQDYPVRIVKLKGEVNAAIGRNEGAKQAHGDILFFIDGDMEIMNDCYSPLFLSENEIVYPFITGHFINRYYSADFQMILKEDLFNSNGSRLEFFERSITGGLLVIEKKYWNQLEGMDERFDSNQDIDFGLRMATIGVKQRVYPNILMVIHHTVSYYNTKRFLRFLISSRLLCPGLLIRKHIFNKQFLPVLFRSRYSLFMLLLSFVILLADFSIGVLLFSVYILLQILRSLIALKKEPGFINNILFKIMYDIYSIVGFIMYYPSRKNYKSNLA